MKTVLEFVEYARRELQSLYDESELQQIIFLLLEDVKGFSRIDLQLKQNEVLGNSELEKLNQYLQQLLLCKPLQYVLGYAWFCGMKFFVDSTVLIPRPETEELCDWIWKLENRNLKFEILDVGTGSGCIAVALKKKNPLATIHALDISEKALSIAKKNAEMNQSEIIFHHGDILSKQFQNSFENKFDVIVSNPPYVKKSEINSMADHVLNFEPHTALFVEDDDALIFYRGIAEFAKTHLNENGKLFFEINEALGAEVKILLHEKGFQNVELRKDISGKDRMVKASS